MRDMRCKFQYTKYGDMFMQLYLLQILSHRYLHLHLPLMHVFNINIIYIPYVSFFILIYFSHAQKNIFPIKCIQELSPLPLTAQVGTAPAAHGALQAMDPKRSWQCTWRCGEQMFDLFFLEEKLGGNKCDYIYTANGFVSIFIYCVYRIYLIFCVCYVFVCSEPLAGSSDIYGSSVYSYFLGPPTVSSLNDLGHLGCGKMMGVTSPSLPSLKLTWHLKIHPWKRRFLLKTIIFRFNVSFREGMFFVPKTFVV